MGRFSVIGAIVIGVLTAASARGADNGLVGWWSFDEKEGRIAHDQSPEGNHGALVGEPRWVEGVRGGAIEFGDGPSGIEIPPSESLNFDGDLTLLVWLKTTSDSGRDRMVFGDGASHSIQRNFNFVLDRGSVYIEHGDTRTRENLTPDVRFAGQWTHVAIVMEHPRCYLYRDGALVWSGAMSLPLTKTPLGKRFIGSWWAGQFIGAMDELKVYRRALPEREIRAEFAGKKVEVPMELLITPMIRLGERALTVNLTVRNAPPEAERADISVIARARPNETLASASVRLVPSRPASERVFVGHSMPMADARPGGHELRVRIRKGEAVMAEGTADFSWPELPAWWQSQAGLSDDVLAPYTPVVIRRPAEGRVSAEVLGREYAFGQGVLDQVRIGSVPLLAAPARLDLTVDGRAIPARLAETKPMESRPSEARIHRAATVHGVHVTMDSAVEYDGLVRVSCTLRAERPLTLDALALHVPVHAAAARLLYTWPTNWGRPGYSGTLQDRHALGFYPIVWIGDEQRGLACCWESEQGWSPERSEKAVEIVRDGQQALLSYRIIQTPVRLDAGAELHYEFTFQSTPVKPIVKDCWDYRFFGTMEYGQDYGMLTRIQNGKPELEYMKALGGRTVLLFNWTDVLTYPLPLGKEQDLRALVARAHELGLPVIVYLGFQISHSAPEYPFVHEEIARLPLISGPDRYPGMDPQMVDTICVRSYWQDCLVHNVARLVAEYDVDGVYLDTTIVPFDCTNVLHGCGYVRADGTRAPHYPVMDVRRLFKRLYTVIRARKPEGIVDAHVWDCMNPAALPFATSYWTGEQLTPHEPMIEGLPLDRFRAEMMGVNWGVPADFLHYQLGDFRKSHAITLLHDVFVRPWLVDRELTSSLWKLMDDFGRKQAQFLPYWSNSNVVSVSPTTCYVSLYRHPANGLLILVSNLGTEQAQGRIVLNTKALDLPGADLTVTDALTQTPVPVRDGVISFDLPPTGWQYLHVHPRR